MTEEKIDIVVLFGSTEGDPGLSARNKPCWSKWQISRTRENDGEQRYRDYGIFNYWFRMIEKHAPWVNRVYLVT